MGIKAKAINCVEYDSDGDGYISCSIAHEDKTGQISIIPVECSNQWSWNEGCRAPKASY